MSITSKLCPVCNKENEDAASICRHCGARLEDTSSTGYVGIPESSEGRVSAPSAQIESFIDLERIPENGIGIQVAGETQPIYASVRKEVVLGRTIEYTPPTDDFLDLSLLNAGTMGVSRKHLMIRRTESGYEASELTSRNGSWMNSERLVPKRPYPLASGSILRIGNMRMLIMYRTSK